jgi:hypothetical protein
MALKKYRYLVNCGFLACCTIILTLALISYSPHDASWFFYATEIPKTYNYLGQLGAHIAAVCFYFFGGAADLLIFFCLFACWIAFKQNLCYEWDRLIAGICVIWYLSVLQSLYGVDWGFSRVPGGLVGQVTAHALINSMQSALSNSILYLWALLCFIILTRASGALSLARILLRSLGLFTLLFRWMPDFRKLYTKIIFKHTKIIDPIHELALLGLDHLAPIVDSVDTKNIADDKFWRDLFERDHSDTEIKKNM